MKSFQEFLCESIYYTGSTEQEKIFIRNNSLKCYPSLKYPERYDCYEGVEIGFSETSGFALKLGEVKNNFTIKTVKMSIGSVEYGLPYISSNMFFSGCKNMTELDTSEMTISSRIGFHECPNFKFSESNSKIKIPYVSIFACDAIKDLKNCFIANKTIKIIGNHNLKSLKDFPLEMLLNKSLNIFISGEENMDKRERDLFKLDPYIYIRMLEDNEHKIKDAERKILIEFVKFAGTADEFFKEKRGLITASKFDI